jgi:hypothetical protein
MSTKAQVKANQQNAKKSTGPQTAEGKAAVSRNAIKHGLFTDSVIKGENPVDYKLFHDKFLAELVPVGMVQSLLYERIVSLAWRLQRAERMQNKVIEDMIECEVINPKARDRREKHCYNQWMRPGDPRFNSDHLALGRIAASDWSYYRILDKLLLYERRIESSLNKTINKLKTYQLMRQIQQAETRKPEPAQAIPKACGFEAATRTAEKEGDLKKQSQFASALMGVTFFAKEDYDNNLASGAEENKPNQACPFNFVQGRL